MSDLSPRGPRALPLLEPLPARGSPPATARVPVGRTPADRTPSAGRSVSVSLLVRLLATVVVLAVATALGAVLVDRDVSGWLAGLAIGLVTVVLAALLWSPRRR
ncbi:hypothetical protein [Conexibacter sp. CPCC 206217]|uniref:hypothetical protein n=1 Tax=Conexibacter sp. CPCC 206217 TaxID=3064574 RepID=UPI002721C08E|nr:hypothetical protein [Conexibacter sp. CPCC 206217]MDO8210026.1 hypothetical protein [Conexibacter sp. CPCC 206217]